MHVKIIISLIIAISACLIIFLASGFRLMEISELEISALEAEEGRVLGAIESAPSAVPRPQVEKPLVENFDSRTPVPYKIENAIDFELEKAAGIVMDKNTEEILFSQNADKPVPIASLTKLATALTFLDYNPGWDEVYQVKGSDIIPGGQIYLIPGDKIKIKDLFYLSLVCSSNSAAKALVGASGLGQAEFVRQMNKKVLSLGLESVNFHEPSGLHSYNRATAYDAAVLAKHAFEDKAIRAATLSESYSFSTLSGRKITVYNTDSLLGLFPQNGIKILGGKTGFTNLAGYCFAGNFIRGEGQEIISIILSDISRKNSFLNTKNMIEWAYANYVWGQ